MNSKSATVTLQKIRTVSTGKGSISTSGYWILSDAGLLFYLIHCILLKALFTYIICFIFRLSVFYRWLLEIQLFVIKYLYSLPDPIRANRNILSTFVLFLKLIFYVVTNFLRTRNTLNKLQQTVQWVNRFRKQWLFDHIMKRSHWSG